MRKANQWAESQLAGTPTVTSALPTPPATAATTTIDKIQTEVQPAAAAAGLRMKMEPQPMRRNLPGEEEWDSQ